MSVLGGGVLLPLHAQSGRLLEMRRDFWGSLYLDGRLRRIESRLDEERDKLFSSQNTWDLDVLARKS